MMELVVEAPYGTYKVRKPVGRWGAKWLAILMEVGDLPTSEDLRELTASERRMLMKSLSEAFEDFVVEILPHIWIDGPYKPDVIPPEDALAIFLKLAQEMKPPTFPGEVPGVNRNTGIDDTSETE